MIALLLSVVVFVPMLVEARRSAANARRLRAAGAVEPRGDVYAVMQLAYPLAFLLPIADAWMRGRRWHPGVAAGAAVFLAAKGLKYWAIHTLGPRWTFRVLIPPASARVTSGPYRVMRHPNYVAVAGELIGVALMAGAPVGGSVATAGFVALMLRRIHVEERALGRGRG